MKITITVKEKNIHKIEDKIKKNKLWNSINVDARSQEIEISFPTPIDLWEFIKFMKMLLDIETRNKLK